MFLKFLNSDKRYEFTSGGYNIDAEKVKIDSADAAGGVAASQNALYNAYNTLNERLNEDVVNISIERRHSYVTY